MIALLGLIVLLLILLVVVVQREDRQRCYSELDYWKQLNAEHKKLLKNK